MIYVPAAFAADAILEAADAGIRNHCLPSPKGIPVLDMMTVKVSYLALSPAAMPG